MGFIFLCLKKWSPISLVVLHLAETLFTSGTPTIFAGLRNITENLCSTDMTFFVLYLLGHALHLWMYSMTYVPERHGVYVYLWNLFFLYSPSINMCWFKCASQLSFERTMPIIFFNITISQIKLQFYLDGFNGRFCYRHHLRTGYWRHHIVHGKQLERKVRVQMKTL